MESDVGRYSVQPFTTVLRVDGLLAYDDDLLDRIGAGELLVAGSPEEVEIRALGVHAVECLREALAERGHDVPSWHLDQVLWLRGGGPRYKALGNSWAVPNVRWIGQRIDAAVRRLQ